MFGEMVNAEPVPVFTPPDKFCHYIEEYFYLYFFEVDQSPDQQRIRDRGKAFFIIHRHVTACLVDVDHIVGFLIIVVSGLALELGN